MILVVSQLLSQELGFPLLRLFGKGHDRFRTCNPSPQQFPDAADWIMMQAKSGTQIPVAREEAGTPLHHLQSDGGDDF